MDPIYVYIVIEDDLSESVVQKIISRSSKPFDIAVVYGRQGNSWIETRISRFNYYAKGVPVIILTDLDHEDCPPKLKNDWLGQNTEHKLLFAVAVEEVEAWIMADRRSFSNYLNIGLSNIPTDVESIHDPKEFLIELAHKSPYGNIKKDIVPPQESTSVQGPGYNERLTAFVENKWNLIEAAKISPSLDRFVNKINSFNP